MLAMATSGFAHRIVAQDIDPDLRAFIQVGGSINDLCGALDGSDHMGSQTCEACLLIAGAFIPPTDFICAMLLGQQAIAPIVARVDPQPSSEIDLSRPVRGPPAI